MFQSLISYSVAGCKHKTYDGGSHILRNYGFIDFQPLGSLKGKIDIVYFFVYVFD